MREKPDFELRKTKEKKNVNCVGIYKNEGHLL